MTIARYASLGVASLLAAVMLAGPAGADGMPTRGRIADTGAVAAPGPNWNGFYVGVGGGVFTTDLAFTHRRLDEDVATHFDVNNGNAFGTVTVGYDRVLRPGWVGGVFGDYDFNSGATGTGAAVNGFSSASTWSVGGRLGFLVTPSSLLYGTAGYTQANLDLFLSGQHIGSQTFNGYFLGAGYETFLRPSWTLKFEYRFSQFDNEFILDKWGQHKSP